jgi:hypothetical protein
MLGDQPPLSSQESLYQRLLAGHAAEAAEDAQAATREAAFISWYDTVLRDALLLAQADLERGVLDQEQQDRIKDTFADIMDDIEAGDDEGGASPLPTLAHDELKEDWRGAAPILVVPARGALDEIACSIFAQLCAKHGLPARVIEPSQLSAIRIQSLDVTSATMACLVCIGSMVSHAGLRFALRRIHRRLPKGEIMLLSWSESLDPKLAEIATFVGAKVVSSMAEALQLTLASAKHQSSGDKIA